MTDKLNGWQPIETAPRDRSRVLLAAGGRTIVGYWWQSDSDPECNNWIGEGGFAVHPTHWMPLPEPPKAE